VFYIPYATESTCLDNVCNLLLFRLVYKLDKQMIIIMLCDLELDQVWMTPLGEWYPRCNRNIVEM
jgi:hypothetical protein